MKIKESTKTDKFFDLAREPRKLWTVRVTVIPNVVGVLGTVLKYSERDLEQLEFEGRIETIQIIALLRSAGIQRKVLETLLDWLSLRLLWKPPANTD